MEGSILLLHLEIHTNPMIYVQSCFVLFVCVHLLSRRNKTFVLRSGLCGVDLFLKIHSQKTFFCSGVVCKMSFCAVNRLVEMERKVWGGEWGTDQGRTLSH